jgi:UDP-N-acetyl-D-glucosamine dehydrogenase
MMTPYTTALRPEKKRASKRMTSATKSQFRSNSTVAVIGLGYVGLPLALLAARKGFTVSGIDLQESKIDLLSQGISPISDHIVEESLRNVPDKRISFSSRYEAVVDASTIVICVPTPVHGNHIPDLGPVTKAAQEIGKRLKQGQLVVLESTVNPGVCEEVVLPILESESGLVGGEDFYLAHCPERINPGDSKWNVENIPRVVGSLEEEGLKRAKDFYSSILTGEIREMGSLKEAEAVKIVENSFRDINIAFVNELAMSFSRLGIDVINVIKGAATKPFAFMAHYPSCGVGGHCIPVDPYYLIEYAEKNGFHHEFLSLARKINNYMPEFTVGQLVSGLNEKEKAPKGIFVAVLGLAYKANISDCRESPSFEIIKHLAQIGVHVKTFDPHVPERSSSLSVEDALDGVYAVVIATPHKEFKELQPEYLLKKGIQVVVDGHNCLDKDMFENAGIVYRGVGR